MRIYQKILNVMKEVQNLQKDMTVGSGNYAYKAISETKVTSEVRKSLIKHGLVFYQHKILKNKMIPIVSKEGKTSWLSLVTVVYDLIDAEEDDRSKQLPLHVESIGSGIDSQDKATGKALTYAYKYALLRLFAIPTGEDPDRKASVDKEGKMKASPKVFNDLYNKVKSGDLNKETVINNFNLTESQQTKLNEL